MAVSIGFFQAAMNSLRAEIPGVIAPMLQALRDGIDVGMHRLNDAALVEIMQHGASVTQLVTEAADASFKSAMRASPPSRLA